MSLEEFVAELEDLQGEASTVLYCSNIPSDEREARVQDIRQRLTQLVTDSRGLA
jgi:hypothetical protein